MISDHDVFNIDRKIASIFNSRNAIDVATYMLIMLIPPGRVISYSTIAKILNVHPRRVAYALKRNVLPIIIPCHRVIRKDGRIAGYSLGGPKIKSKLLELEGVRLIDNRIADKKYFYCSTLIELVGDEESGV